MRMLYVRYYMTPTPQQESERCEGMAITVEKNVRYRDVRMSYSKREAVTSPMTHEEIIRYTSRNKRLAGSRRRVEL